MGGVAGSPSGPVSEDRRAVRPRETAVWFVGIGPKLKEKLAAVALIEPEQRLTVGEFLAGWLEGKKAGGFKPASIISWGQTTDELTALLGARPVATVARADGEAYRAAMQAR